MARDVIDLKGNVIQADRFEPTEEIVVGVAITSAIPEAATQVVAADDTVAEALQKIVTWVETNFTEAT